MQAPSKSEIELNTSYLRGQLSAGELLPVLKMKQRHTVEARMARVTRWRVVNGQIKLPKR